MLFTCLLFYFVLINIVSAIICVVDKLSAIWRKRRISEKTLILLSILGGSIGMYLTMVIIRHKTKHIKFMLGIPAIIMLQLIILLIFSKIFETFY